MQHAYIDQFATLDSPLHRLDPRAKILAVIGFITLVISVPRQEIFTLVPFAVYPVLLITIAGIPLGRLLKHALMVSPFILSLAVFAPVFDQTPVGTLGGIPLTAGWLTSINITLKFFITVLATLALVATTRFDRLLFGLDKLGVPRVLVMQLSFLYRYLFVLVEEASAMMRARDARNFARAPLRRKLGAVRGIVAVLFVKTLNRAERVYAAMAARGFAGRIHMVEEGTFGVRDWLFLAGTGVMSGWLRWML